ncbi:hypothetical protein [Cytobacillus oceanisediminis]|uniref:Uncharacterized protein n=1 Tax=Cytobacillus oceanisediminis TaxID=665099 RepID=A0A562JIS2_9BACI|nr:hypothetical protein [Cytobacillus oceanisediminis]TWH83038.1 hypothetical protein IQ19_04020 [Cytobacillus oceanisediminis]
MKSWQHNIETIRTFEDYYLFSGTTYDHDQHKSISWCYLVDGNGKLRSGIEPEADRDFYYTTGLCGCLSEIVSEYICHLPFLFKEFKEVEKVYHTRKNDFLLKNGNLASY